MTQTHYRKAFNSPYLSSADIVGPTVLTIKYVKLEPDKTKKTKEHFNTAYFAETHIREGEVLKPMILNATNSRTVKCFVNSPFIEEWVDIPVTIYVDDKVRFGRDTVEGLRISQTRPNLTKPDLTPDNIKAWERAIESFREHGNFDLITPHMNISEEHMELIKGQANVS